MDTRTGKVHYQSSYYALGHFSRFFRPGRQRILCATNRDDLEAMAVVHADGSVAVGALNRTDKPLDFRLVDGEARVEIPLPAHGMVTVRTVFGAEASR